MSFTGPLTWAWLLVLVLEPVWVQVPDQVSVLEPAGLSAEQVPVLLQLGVAWEQQVVLQEPVAWVGTPLVVLH